jgi:hypothetical protein
MNYIALGERLEGATTIGSGGSLNAQSGGRRVSKYQQHEVSPPNGNLKVVMKFFKRYEDFLLK